MKAAIDAATARYIARIRGIPALEREEELALAGAYRAGDIGAGQRVVSANLRHVVPQAWRLRGLGVSLAELIAQGNLGLTLALRRFEPERGVRFATYASYFIRSEMLAFATRAKTLVGAGLGPMRAKYVVSLRREHARLLTQLGNEDEVRARLAADYRQSAAQIATALYRSEAADASLDARGRHGEQPLLDQLVAPTAGQDTVLIEERSRSEIEAAVKDALRDLNQRDRYLAEHRLMADDEARQSLSQVARRFGVSRERARQLEHSLKQRLRSRLTRVCEDDPTRHAARSAAASLTRRAAA